MNRNHTAYKNSARLFAVIVATVLPGALFAASSSDSPSPVLEVAGKNVVPATAKHSFIDPIEGFTRDSILRPTDPFQLVPGKDPNGWSFVIEPYVWAMGVEGKTGVGGLPAMSVNVDAIKVLKHLDWAIFSKAEIRKGRWGILADGYYAALSGSGDLGGVLYKSGSLQMQQGLASLALAYRIIDDRRGFLDVYAGARYNYLGIQMDLTQDSGGIDALGQQISGKVASDISAKIQSLIGSFLPQTEAALAGAVESEVAPTLLSKSSKSKALPKNIALLERLADPSPRRDRGIQRVRAQDRAIVRAIDRSQLRDVLASAKGDIRAYIRAEAAARLAAANGTLTGDIQDRADAAKNRLAKSISNALEQSLPTHGAGDQWWVDPIMGLRGQINITRWLFLAAQGDAGGFGAGSQITWNTQATVGVNFTRNIFAELGYRYMYVDYNKNNFLYQMNSFGLFSSLGVKF